MKWKIVLLIALVVGSLGGSWLKNLPGFVIIAYEKTSYEMRLWVAIVLILFVWSLFLLLGILLRSMLSGAGKMKNWRGGRQWKIARKKTIQGMLAFSEGRWQQSEKTMIAAAKQSDTKLVNYLIAAQAAQHQESEDQSSVERRDAYLRAAYKLEPSAGVAIGITQAQLQYDNLQYEQALATLSELKAQSPNHPFIIKLLYLTHKRLNDWQSIVDLLPAIKKYKVYSKEKLSELENQSIQAWLNTIAESKELEKLKDTWQKLPKAIRKNDLNHLFYIKLLVSFEQMDESERLIKPYFKKNINEEIIQRAIELYGEINSNNPNQQFNFIESWYTQSKNVPNTIYLTLGKIAFNAELWGKARFYLERSLQSNPSPETYLIMAKTLGQLNDQELASDCYKKGLEFALGGSQSRHFNKANISIPLLKHQTKSG